MKIGVLTQYYNSFNYGGLLQAYALVTVLNKMGNQAEQICYDAQKYINLGEQNNSKRNIRALISKTGQSLFRVFIKKQIENRNKKISDFRNSINHSKIIYTADDIKKTNKDYDAFVVGSDQVWNPKDYDPVFFLSFVQSDKLRMSYAASISQKKLTLMQQNCFKEHLKAFKAISLRENDVELIQNLSPVKVEWVVDPTLLLSKEEWDAVATKRIIENQYIFCYFLGQDMRIRKLSKQFAETKNMKLVTMPHITGMYRRCDRGFGDIQILDASPGEFISLIKNAEYILTDSFHASVFSIIYEKEFFVFHRQGFQEMSTRIETLLSLLEAEDHFCDRNDKLSIEYLSTLPIIRHNAKDKILSMKQKSYLYLENALRQEEIK